MVKTPVGGTSTNTHNLTYVGKPTITTLTPSSGKATTTQTVTVTGTNLTTASAVTVGGTPGTIDSTTSATQIKVTLPAKTTGSYPVVVTAFDGTSTNSHSFTYVADSPDDHHVTPSKGKATGGLST